MAIGLRMKIEGGTAEMYDALDGGMNIDADPPEGLIFHAAGPIEGGWGILDFWESRAHFDRFQESRLGPAMAAGGGDLPAAPQDVVEFPVHNIHKP